LFSGLLKQPLLLAPGTAPNPSILPTEQFPVRIAIIQPRIATSITERSMAERDKELIKTESALGNQDKVQYLIGAV
jgi:hypothetical protein